MRNPILGAAVSLLLASTTATQLDAFCKCYPGDACWPAKEEWDRFNSTVGGRLIATEPLDAPCHDPKYNEKACSNLQAAWQETSIHFESSSSMMAPFFANQSCDPFQPRGRPCLVGTYVQYTVNASSVEDVSATVKFAAEKNIRFVIRNTGHDYLGRSTGAGALAIWTHHFKETEILQWDDSEYNGPALKMGAGVQGFEALAAVRSKGLVVVTGECPSVGVAGGYTQGGGHSALSTNYGLGADNTLEFEVVTANGEFVKASRLENKDLFWALSGSGVGNYGVVTSMTVRAHPDAKVSGTQFSYEASKGNKDTLYDAIDAFHAALPAIVDSGVMIVYVFSDTSLEVFTMTAYNKTQEEAELILKPFLDAMEGMNAPILPKFTEFPSYHDHFDHYWGPAPAGNIQVGHEFYGARLLPRSVLPTFGPTARKLAKMGVTFIGVGLNVSRHGDDGSRAVLPQWRQAAAHVALTLPWSFEAPWEEMVAMSNKMTYEVQPLIEAATPGAGAYINEADFQQQNWQENFYGVNYKRLLEVKEKYDPEGLLYSRVAVGSEAWTVEENGRMCRNSKRGEKTADL